MLYESPHLSLVAEYGIATLTLLKPLGDAALTDLATALDIAHARPGLDVFVLTGNGSPVAEPPNAALGQRVARRLAALDCVTLAVLDGPWLGGSLELALACDYRAAVGSAQTRLGFPQVRAGRVPCWGGTVRLPRRIGLRRALRLLFSGRKLSAAQALAAGLVDRAFGPRLAAVGCDRFILDLQASGQKSRCRRRLRDRLPWRREAILTRAATKLHTGISADHVAAWETLAAVAAGIRGGTAEGYAAERRAAGMMATRIEPEAPAREATFPLAGASGSMIRVGIVGGGTVGAALAQWLSMRGCAVAVRDRDPKAVRARLAANFRDAVAKRLILDGDAAERLAAIPCSTGWDGFAGVDVLIEAVGETKRVKRQVLCEAEAVAGPAAVLATTSTSYTVRALQKALDRPSRLVGLHVGVPAAALKCVELVAGPATDPTVLGKLRDLLTTFGKTPVVVADRPGRVLGRVLLPYLHEAILAAEEGIPVDALDAVLRRFGMAWGPFEALDAAGLDVVRASMARLARHIGPSLTPPPLLDRLIAAGRHGRKTGVGFYRHVGRPTPNRRDLPPPRRCDPAAIGRRLLVRLLTAARHAVSEGATRNLDDINALLLDAGWPAFRGGPLRVVAARGAA